MILVFSERNDLNTRHVLAYLHHFGELFEVFLEDDFIELDYGIDPACFDYQLYKNHQFVCSAREIKSVWYRRTDIQVCRFGSGAFSQKGLEHYAREHIKTRSEQIQRCMHGQKCLGKFGFGNYNKVEFLEKCAALQIDIPKTLITGSKKKLRRFWSECGGKVITKSLAYPYEYAQYDETGAIEGYRLGYTISVGESELVVLPEFFDLSLFQEKLEKQFEIRTIYLNGKTYSQAIFSQDRQESSLDYRQGYDSGMRTCSYTLPESVEKQVSKLMCAFDLNFGSLDIVVTTGGRYVFLEVNPNGQYGAVSWSTNANVDYEVARFLMNRTA